MTDHCDFDCAAPSSSKNWHLSSAKSERNFEAARSSFNLLYCYFYACGDLAGHLRLSRKPKANSQGEFRKLKREDHCTTYNKEVSNSRRVVTKRQSIVMPAAVSYTGRYVFVAGLHRTGTSLLARLLSRSPHIATIANSSAPENEGCYLQGAIPHTAQHGIPGKFATDPAQHLVEGCVYDTLMTRERMEADWKQWFDLPIAAWRLEKSPVNLTRMRLYQQLFPLAQFIVILRHPAAMAAALQKWTGADPGVLIDYALDAYDIVNRDLPYLHAVSMLRYEDLVAAPQPQMAALFAVLGLDMPDLSQCFSSLRNGNAEYTEFRNLTPEQAARADRWGYGPDLSVKEWQFKIQHPLRLNRETAMNYSHA